MRIDFSARPDQTDGAVTFRAYSDAGCSVVPCRVHPGGEIPAHRCEGGEEIRYVLYGTGEAVIDGTVEPLSTDICAIAPAGSECAIRNTGGTDLVLLCVSVKR